MSVFLEIEHLLTLVNEAYRFDDDKELLEHSLELTSMEFVNRFHKINEENNKLISSETTAEQEEKLS